MSWSIWSMKVDSGEGLEQKLRAAVSEQIEKNPTPFTSEETKEQVEAGIQTILFLVQNHAKAVGGSTFFVGMSGHSNPGHARVEGYANDCVSVSVSQA